MNTGQLVLFVTFLVTTLAQWLRERRARKWALEDRQRQQDELFKHELAIKKKLDEQTKEIQATVDDRTAKIRRRLNGLLEPEDLP